MVKKGLSAELRLKNYRTSLGETSGNEEVRHIANAKLVGVFNTFSDVDIDITLKGDIGKIDSVLEALNIPNIRDVLELNFVTNPQVRMDQLEKKIKKESND